MMTRIGLGILALAMAVFGAPAVAHAGAEVSILIYGPSLNGSPRNEQTVAERLGYSVTVADESTWSSYTTDDFASYDAIVFGDPTCGQKQLLATAEATRAVWSPAVTGNIMVIGMDPIYHQPKGDTIQLVANGIHFAADVSGRTGMYFDLSCYYEHVHMPTHVLALREFGTIKVTGACADGVFITRPGHPAMHNLTSNGLSNWICSIHEEITQHPRWWTPLATDAITGEAVILASKPGSR
jgi:hypothetical protein